MGEDCGLLGVIATQTGAKAYNTMDFPATISILAVQRATGITLKSHNTTVDETDWPKHFIPKLIYSPFPMNSELIIYLNSRFYNVA